MIFKTASIIFLFIIKFFHLINKKKQLWKLFIVISREEKVYGKIISKLFTILIIAEREWCFRFWLFFFQVTEAAYWKKKGNWNDKNNLECMRWRKFLKQLHKWEKTDNHSRKMIFTNFSARIDVLKWKWNVPAITNRSVSLLRSKRWNSNASTVVSHKRMKKIVL
jgi:hypothetical protein